MIYLNAIFFGISLLAFCIYIYNRRIFIKKKTYIMFFFIVIFVTLIDIFFNFAENVSLLQYTANSKNKNIFFTVFLMGAHNMSIDNAIDLCKSYIKFKGLDFNKNTLLIMYNNEKDYFIKGFLRFIIYHIYPNINLPVDKYCLFIEDCFTKQYNNLGINMNNICKVAFQKKDIPFSYSELEKAQDLLNQTFTIFCNKYNYNK